VYLLDTNVISELRHGKPQQSQAVRAWAADKEMSRLFLSAITVLELEKGVQALERKLPPQGSALRDWLDRVKNVFADRILPFTQDTAVLCAGMHFPNPKPERDAMIAATALQHRMTLVTRNTVDFENTGVALINPFTDDAGATRQS
jgi:predicted nucleic acid-binding protein